MEDVARVATKHAFDEIVDGDHLLFLMLVSGRPSQLLAKHKPARVTVEVQIRPDESFFHALANTTIDGSAASKFFQPVHDADTWIDDPRLDGLNDRVEWYYRVRVKATPVLKLVMQQGPSKTTIERGVRQVRRLLGIPIKKGRPSKKSSPEDRKT